MQPHDAAGKQSSGISAAAAQTSTFPARFLDKLMDRRKL